MINPFVKFAGLEFFGTYEMSKGNSQVENGEIQYSNPALGEITKLERRQFNQYEADLVYRFGKGEKFYVGAKYNLLEGTLAFGQSTTATNINQGTRKDVTIDRTSFAAGWYITRNIMLKGEYVTQTYKGYPEEHILSGGKFNGFVLQGAIGF
jgi:putative salt-induced outer membrane protein YdiY